MEHYDDYYRNGSPSHMGICPECGEYNGTCYNDLCERCQSLQPVICPQCKCSTPYEDMTSHGICTVCLDENAERFTKKFLYLTSK